MLIKRDPHITIHLPVVFCFGYPNTSGGYARVSIWFLRAWHDLDKPFKVTWYPNRIEFTASN